MTRDSSFLILSQVTSPRLVTYNGGSITPVFRGSIPAAAFFLLTKSFFAGTTTFWRIQVNVSKAQKKNDKCRIKWWQGTNVYHVPLLTSSQKDLEGKKKKK